MQGEAQVGHQEEFFTEKFAKHWDRLPREVIKFPSLELFKK